MKGKRREEEEKPGRRRGEGEGEERRNGRGKREGTKIPTSNAKKGTRYDIARNEKGKKGEGEGEAKAKTAKSR